MPKHLLLVCVTLIVCVQFLTGAARAQDLAPADLAAMVRSEVAGRLDPEIGAALTNISGGETAEGAEGLAHALLMNRHLDESAYFFALAVEHDPQRATALSGLGVTALEMLAAGRPLGALDIDAIVALQRAALAAAPDAAAVKHNLATALLRQGDNAAMAEAVGLLRDAVAAEPQNSLYALRLAEALKLTGDDAEAASALGTAFAADPSSPALSVANAEIFGGGAITPPANACSIDFRCPEICPGGIIGQVNRVTCEIENASAQGNCAAGKPFAMSFDCDAQMPRFGILIPGLDPGFSILTPWGSIDVLIQGDGSVDYRIKWLSAPTGPVQAFVDSQGSYQPSTGEMQWDVGAGLQYNLFNENAVLNLANEYDIGPSGVVRYSTDQAKVEARLDGGRGIFISN